MSDNSNSTELPTTAFVKPNRVVKRVYIHCSDSVSKYYDEVSEIRRDHVENRGWMDIGYHYVVRLDGVLEHGRSLESHPAAQYPDNRDTIAICLIGRGAKDFTEKQLHVLKELCCMIDIAYGGAVTFHGHKEINPGKLCPNFDYKTALNLDTNGNMLYN